MAKCRWGQVSLDEKMRKRKDAQEAEVRCCYRSRLIKTSDRISEEEVKK
jgi:hypothetical protein